jgi:hypothetical protein
MPLDDLKWTSLEVETDTPLARRRRLIEALRRPIPNWDFADARRCAMPIAKKLFGKGWRKNLAISVGQGIRIFGVFAPVGYSRYYGCPTRKVTPLMVADALERIGGQ